MAQDMLGNLSLSEVRGPKNDLDEKLAGPNGRTWLQAFNRFLRKENPWEGPILFEVISDGFSGKGWIDRLEKNRWNVGDYAKQLLRSDAFVATNGVTYRLGLIKGDEFGDEGRFTENIRAEASRRGWLTPPAECAPLLRGLVSDEEIEALGLYWLVVMHELIKDSDGDPGLLGLYRRSKGRWLGAFWDGPGSRWGRGRGFVFLVPQVG